MAQLSTKVKLYLEANSKTWDKAKVELQDDGDGAYIKLWDYDIAQPTAEQIASYETAGNAAETLQGVLNTRRTEYPSIADQLDKIYHDGIDEWKKVIKKVKDDNPKS